MAIDTSVPRTRRALLAGGIGGLAALVASALGRPLPVRADEGDVIHVGDELTATSVTKLTNATNHANVLEAESDLGVAVCATSTSNTAIQGTSTSGAGVSGNSASSAGVWGMSGSGTGVMGLSVTTGHGVAGSSVQGRGVFGVSDDGIGVLGWSKSLTGVLGFVGTSTPPAGPASTAVYGEANGSTAMRGVHGRTTSGRGVYGQATSGQGVRGYATSGSAGYFASADPMAGYALRAVGRVKLDKCAGVATIGATKSSVVVTPGIDLTSTSAVVASLMGSAGGTTTVHRSVVNATANTFTIYLTKAATQQVKVAWHVFG